MRRTGPQHKNPPHPCPERSERTRRLGRNALVLLAVVPLAYGLATATPLFSNCRWYRNAQVVPYRGSSNSRWHPTDRNERYWLPISIQDLSLFGNNY